MKPRPHQSKIRSPRALKRILASRGKKKAVFTNGCFDLIHKGHVTYLAKAKAQGDLLIVALNGDSSVRKLKGKGRPINPLEDRLEVIAALESVDYVTWFGDSTPLKLIELLRPDILVKGGDWSVASIVGAREVKSWGGRVKSLAFVSGRSTSMLIARSRKVSAKPAHSKIK